jgi:hypothetical protein
MQGPRIGRQHRCSLVLAPIGGFKGDILGFPNKGIYRSGCMPLTDFGTADYRIYLCQSHTPFHDLTKYQQNHACLG